MTSRKPHRILIIDGHLETRVVARWMMRQAFPHGEFPEADSIQFAIEQRLEDNLNCVLLDASIEDFESNLTLLAAQLKTRRLPLVILASRSQWTELDVAAKLGFRLILEWESLVPRTVELTIERAIDVNNLEVTLAARTAELNRLRDEHRELENSASRQSIEVELLTARLAEQSACSSAELQRPTLARPAPTAAEPEVDVDFNSARWTVSAREEDSPVPPSTRKSPPSPGLVKSGFATPSAEEDELARRIHKDLLPPGSPLVDGYDIAGASLQAGATGGDYYDYLPMADDLLTISIGECSGRGIAPALLMASLRAYLRVLSGTTVDASEILSRANDLITEDIGDEEFLLTLMLVQIDQLTRTVRYASAGHQGYLIDREGETQTLPSTGMPMGLRTNTVIPEGISRKLRGGDIVLMTTDGIQKTESSTGETFGTDRMLEVVRENRELPARMIVTYLMNACRDFAGDNVRSDDATAVIVKCEARTLF